MNEVSMVATDDGRPYRLVRVATLAMFMLGLFWLGVAFLFPPPDLAGAMQQAAKVQANIRQHPQFSEVQVTALTNGKLSVSAPATLLPTAKIQLEHLVTEHVPDRATSVSYLLPIPDFPASSNPR